MLDRPAGPMDLDVIGLGILAQSEMKPLIVRGSVTASAEYVAAHPHAAGSQIDRGTDRIARTSGAAQQFDPYPVIFVRTDIAQQSGWPVQPAENHIDLSLIEKIAK